MSTKQDVTQEATPAEAQSAPPEPQVEVRHMTAMQKRYWRKYMERMRAAEQQAQMFLDYAADEHGTAAWQFDPEQMAWFRLAPLPAPGQEG